MTRMARMDADVSGGAGRRPAPLKRFCSALAGRITLLAAAALAAGVMHCAHQVPPGGGPADTTPPGVRVAMPEDRAVGVPRDMAVELTFSEWITPQKADRSVTMFPPPPGGYDVRVRGKTLAIRPRELLAESTTYHVEVTNALSDLHANPVGTPFHLVFSTGPTLDSGSVAGCVVDPAKRVLQPTVALMRADTGFADTMLFAGPTYVTQTDSAGRFALEHVRPGTYELVAFDDANHDSRLQPGREQAYASLTRRIEVGLAQAGHVLYPVSCDTTVRRIVSCNAVSDRLVLGSWSRRPPAVAAGDLPVLRIAAADTVKHEPRIASYVPLAGGSRFALVLAEPLRLLPYRLHYDIVPALPLPDSVSTRDSVRFNGVTGADTVRPKTAAPPMVSGPDLGAALTLAWSEPVRMVARRLALTDTLGDTITLAWDTAFAETLVFTPGRPLCPGRSYAAELRAADIADLSGLHPADTPAVELRVTTLPVDSFCSTFSGGADCLPSDPRRVWRFSPLRGGRPYQTRDSGGKFRYDTIPGGKGILSFFSDPDSDGVQDRGELVPWWPPEPVVPLYDTVEARARWDVKGVPVRGCDPCERGQILRVDTAAVQN